MRKGDSLPSYPAQEKGRWNAQKVIEKRMRELHDEMESEPQQVLCDAQDSAKAEYEEQRELLARQKREGEDREIEKESKEKKKGYCNLDLSC